MPRPFSGEVCRSRGATWGGSARGSHRGVENGPPSPVRDPWTTDAPIDLRFLMLIVNDPWAMPEYQRGRADRGGDKEEWGGLES